MNEQMDKIETAKAALERLKYSMHLAENKLRDARESFNDALAALSTPQPAVTVSVEELEKFIVEKTICPMDEIYYGTTACRMWAKRAATAVLSRLNITPAEATPAATKEPGKTLAEQLREAWWSATPNLLGSMQPFEGTEEYNQNGWKAVEAYVRNNVLAAFIDRLDVDAMAETIKWKSTPFSALELSRAIISHLRSLATRMMEVK